MKPVGKGVVYKYRHGDSHSVTRLKIFSPANARIAVRRCRRRRENVGIVYPGNGRHEKAAQYVVVLDKPLRMFRRLKEFRSLRQILFKRQTAVYPAISVCAVLPHHGRRRIASFKLYRSAADYSLPQLGYGVCRPNDTIEEAEKERQSRVFPRLRKIGSIQLSRKAGIWVLL